jgi:hypothetical protein
MEAKKLPKLTIKKNLNRPSMEIESVIYLLLWTKLYPPIPKYIYWNPNPNMVAFRDGDFGRWLDLDGVMKAGLSWMH